uniref:Platelet-derived growth factor (PDGF) family profile domain-containing protein n=1 Tax=Denticeps clupeoides TaxID=299321 RepID=A0AAY4BA86_9TELE
MLIGQFFKASNPEPHSTHLCRSVLNFIMEEMQRTACRPREVCLEVSKEFPESANHIYLPRCVSVHRCGGCCPNEALQCTNTSYAIINKTLVELSPPRMENSVVMVAVVNHTSCECQSKRPRHTIIRRAAAEYPTLYVPSPQTFGYRMSASTEEMSDPMDSALLAICGPNKLLDEESCGCVCRNGLTEASCAPGWRLDEMSCKCVCEGLAAGQTCPPNQHWDQDLCGCVCQIQCPPSHPLHPETCTCQCRENEHTCLQQGKKFRSENCSCYRLPCKDPHKKCQNGHFYSPLVCSCIPNYLRSWS